MMLPAVDRWLPGHSAVVMGLTCSNTAPWLPTLRRESFTSVLTPMTHCWRISKRQQSSQTRSPPDLRRSPASFRTTSSVVPRKSRPASSPAEAWHAEHATRGVVVDISWRPEGVAVWRRSADEVVAAGMGGAQLRLSTMTSIQAPWECGSVCRSRASSPLQG